jgi:hypothetical protein
VLRRIRSSTTLALLLSPVGVILVAATRLMIVSDYNSNTALAILRSAGYVNTLLGSIIPLVPILMPWIALLLLCLNQIFASVLAFAAALLISPVPLTGQAVLSIARHDLQLTIERGGGWDVLAVVLAIGFAVLLLVELTAFGIRASVRSAALAATVALVPVMFRLYPLPASNDFYTSLLTQPWLPAETITLTTHQSVTGYVLESDQDWVQVLLAGNRTVVQYHTSQVSSRAMCQIPVVASERPLFPLIKAQSSLPLCVLPAPATGSGGALHPRQVTGTPLCRTAVRRCE